MAKHRLSKRCAVQVISSKIEGQRYVRSSSFKMAALFTALLLPCIAIAGYLALTLSRQGAGLSLVMLCGLAAALMLAVIGVSFFISLFVVSRTNRIARTAQEIMETGNLAQRIELDSRWDDLSYLSGVLNRFLERNEDLVEGIQRVSDNIAHDLRTPLTRLRNNLEDLKGKNGGAVDDAAEALIAEADHLLGTFNALLRIARIETAQQRSFAPVRLDALLRDIAELYEPVAEQKGMKIMLDAVALTYTGDRNLLFQAFANVVDNAIKFGAAGTSVDIVLAQTQAAVTCTVRDYGGGIAAHEHDKVFRRFYRGEHSRSTQGNGLGLSLVQAVVLLHGGRIALEDASPGLRVKMTFI